MTYLINKLGDANQNPIGLLFVQTASATIANSTTETAISSTGVGSLTLPANFFIIGRTIRITGRGFHSSTANPNITLKIKFGSTVMLTTGAVQSKNGSSDAFVISGDITCRTTGASGAFMSQGQYLELQSTGVLYGMKNTATVAVDTTTTQAITVTAQWGTANAGNTITLTNLTVESLN